MVNVVEAAWLRNEAFGGRCVFESSPRVLGDRPDLEPQMFTQVGFTLAVLEPGKPSGLYHGESNQEDFLVLAGECLMLVEGEERPLRAWDFVHCPAGTKHIILGAGDGPCVVLAVGAREHQAGADWGGYSVDEVALRHGVGVVHETSDAEQAYARFPEPVPTRYHDDWLPTLSTD